MRDVQPNEDQSVYPYTILRLNCISGFIDAVYEYIELKGSTLAAYDFVEAMHERYFGRRRYEDYTNFMTARAQYWRRQRKNKRR